MKNNNIYYIIKNNTKYKIETPKNGISIGTNLDNDKEQIDIKIAELSKIYAKKEENNKEIIRNISPQQWLIEIDALETANEWETNSFALQLFMSISVIFCELGFWWLRMPLTNWTFILFLIGLGSSIWGYKNTKKKYFIVILICCVIVFALSYILAYMQIQQ